MNIVKWTVFIIESALGLVLLKGILGVLPKDLWVPPGVRRVRVFSTIQSISFLWGKTIFNCHFIRGIHETDVFRTFLLLVLGAGCSLNGWSKSGNERTLCCCSWMPRAAAAKRSKSLVSGYSSAPRPNGVLHCLLPDLRYLGDVTASSVSGVFILLLERALLSLSFSVCRVWGPPVSLRVGTVYRLLCLILQWCAGG